MRLIDADDIAYESIDSSDTNRHEYYYGTGIVAIRKEDIDEQPTVDAVPVVRCKDCKYYSSVTAHCEIRGKGLFLIRGMNDFCSRAERKSDENNATD